MKIFLSLFVIAMMGSVLHAEETPQQATKTFRLLGLFMQVRAEAFEEAMSAVEDLEVASVNYKAGEVTLRLSGTLGAGKGDDEQQLRALNERIRVGTKGAFELLAAQPKPLSERTRIEIGIKGHDCLGCSFGAYRALYKFEGVYRVTADFGKGQLVAWIDPEVTNRDSLAEELVRKKVVLEDSSGQ